MDSLFLNVPSLVGQIEIYNLNGKQCAANTKRGCYPGFVKQRLGQLTLPPERLAFADVKGRGLFQGRAQRNKVVGRRKVGAVVKRVGHMGGRSWQQS